MKRLALKAIAVGSAVLTVALVALWVRSYYVLDEVSRVDERGLTQAAVSFAGAVHLCEINTSGAARPLWWDAYPYAGSATLGPVYDGTFTDWQALGFAGVSGPADGGSFRAAVPGPPPGPGLPRQSVPITPWLAGRTYDAVVIPYWAPTLLAFIPALLGCRSLVRRFMRRRRGLCLACGYDLRATGERCPECGATVPARRRARTAALQLA